MLRFHFAIVRRFFFGIYFNIEGCNDCSPIKPYLSHINSSELDHCHYAFEARNADFENNIILKSIRLSGSFSHSTAHDCTAVLYIIDKMQECH